MPDIQGDISKAKTKLDNSGIKGTDFDSQGFYVFTEGDKGLNATSSTAVHASCNNDQLTKFITSLANDINPNPSPDLINSLTDVYTNHPQAITNLERAFKNKFAQIARSYQKSLGENFNKKIDYNH